jgi:adenylate kinase family enzyme
LLAYNLVRVRMAQAAALHDRLPRSLSFTSAKNHIHNFAAHLATAGKSQYQHLEAELLHAITTCRLACRTGRKEPRAVKKRRQKYSYLTKPRIVARQPLAA